MSFENFRKINLFEMKPVLEFGRKSIQNNKMQTKSKSRQTASFLSIPNYSRYNYLALKILEIIYELVTNWKVLLWTSDFEHHENRKCSFYEKLWFLTLKYAQKSRLVCRRKSWWLKIVRIFRFSLKVSVGVLF